MNTDARDLADACETLATMLGVDLRDVTAALNSEQVITTDRARDIVAAANPRERAALGTHRAGQAWTPDEHAEVHAAVMRVAAHRATFTADDVWAEVGDRAPVGKGLAGVLRSAAHHGHIRNTGTTVYTTRGGVHDAGQRLTVWESLLLDPIA